MNCLISCLVGGVLLSVSTSIAAEVRNGVPIASTVIRVMAMRGRQDERTEEVARRHYSLLTPSSGLLATHNRAVVGLD
jgi:hypothetical protein